VLDRLRALGRRGMVLVALGAGAVVIVVAAAAFKPATRVIAANETLCFGCHFSQDFDTRIENAASKRHPESPEAGQTARCVDCHVPNTLAGSVFVYTHYLGQTDLFGNLRRMQAKTEGPYLSPAEKKAYAVRDALQAADSGTCRTCHIESEIKPKRPRGRNAHAQALRNKQTCIECHFNLVHTEVELRPVAAK